MSWRTTVEFLICFIILPILYWLDWIPVHKIIPLLILFVYCLGVLISNRQLTKSDFMWAAEWRIIFLRFMLLSIFILLFVYFTIDHQIIADFGSNRKLVHMILLYPLLSAFPQELIFRKFFTFRYDSLLTNRTLYILLNAAVFAFAHLYFLNGVVIAFSFVGGVLFSSTYLKSKSVFVVTIEHSLYGLLILCTQLSEQFYKAF